MKRFVKILYWNFLKFFFPIIHKTKGTAAPITLKTLLMQKVLGFNRKAYWPCHFTSVISNPKNIRIGIGTAPGLSPGCYIQGGGKIYLGDYTIVAPNVGIISANHKTNALKQHVPSEVRIGNYCWIGMNSVILPGVTLGDFTIVGAGSVATKSFPDGYCVVAGNPAKLIKRLDPKECVRHQNKFEYYGYIPKEKFSAFRAENLNA